MGAWIETLSTLALVSMTSVAPRGGVDRNLHRQVSQGVAVLSPLAWGRGSKRLPTDEARAGSCRPSRGGVDRNSITETLAWPEKCRPSRGGVDRNLHQVADVLSYAGVASHVGAWIETAPC